MKPGKELKADKPPKADDILKIGDIKSIQLSVEGLNGIYELTGSTAAL